MADKEDMPKTPLFIQNQLVSLRSQVDQLTELLNDVMANPDRSESDGSTVSVMRKFLMTNAYRKVTKDKLQTANKLNNDLLQEAEYWRNKWCDFYIQVFYANKSGLTEENAKSTIEQAKLEMRDFVTPIKQTERIRHFADARAKAKKRIDETLTEKLKDNLTSVIAAEVKKIPATVTAETTASPEGTTYTLTEDSYEYINYMVEQILNMVHSEESKMSAALLDPESYDVDAMKTLELDNFDEWKKKKSPPS